MRETLKFYPAHVDAALLLGEIYEQQGKRESAKEVYSKALSSRQLSDQDSRHLTLKLQALKRKDSGE